MTKRRGRRFGVDRRMGVGEGEIITGGQQAQRELKGYSLMTEVKIPLLQAFWVTVALDVVGGLLVWAAIWAGPGFWKVALGLVVGTVTLVGVFRTGDGRRAVVGFVTGSAVLACIEGGLVYLETVWPVEWLVWPELWRPWAATVWVGPLAGCGLLIWRFANELRDPFWPAPVGVRPLEEEAPSTPAVRDRPVYIQRWNNHEPVPEPVVQQPRRPEYTLADDLRAFVMLAWGRGLERSSWIEAGAARVRLWPSGRVVTRGCYDQLMGILREANIVTWDGSGSSAEWSCSPDQALACLDVWEGGQEAGGQEAGGQETGGAGGDAGLG